MKVCLITWKVPQCLSPLWEQQVQNETVILSLHPFLSFSFISSHACLHLQTMTRLIINAHLQPPLLVMGPHKQGHSDCCKRKMYHLLRDKWQDVSAKSFYFDHKYYCNPAAPIPLPSNWTRRQKATATLAAEETASSVWWKNTQTVVEKWVYLFNDLTQYEDKLETAIFDDNISGQWGRDP